MSKIDEGFGRRRVTGIFAGDLTMARPSVCSVEPNERMRGDYVAIHNHARRILSEAHADARECAFPIQVDGVTYHFNAIIDENGHLTCRFVVIHDGEFAEEGYVRYPKLEHLFTKSILTYNLQPAFPLKEIGAALFEEIKSMVKVEVRTRVRERKMTTMDASTRTQMPAVKRKPTSYPLSDDARQLAEHLIANKDQYTSTASRTKSHLRDGRMFEVLVRRVEEGLLLSYRDHSTQDFSVIFVPLNFEQEAYIKLPQNPPWADLKFVLGIR
jgi:hypothetical protein